jgi:Caspase domain
MKARIFLFVSILSLVISHLAYSQTGESKFKMVIINQNEKKVAQLFTSFKITDLSFTDENKNQQLDGKETGSINFYIKNTGTVLLQELNVNLNTPDEIKGITYSKAQIVKQINFGDSVLVNVLFTADENIKDGQARFDITVKDTRSDSTKMAQMVIQMKELLIPPVFTWIAPTPAEDSTDFSVINISGLIKTKSNITGLKVYINGEVPEDSKSFEVIATQNQDEYRISRNIALNDGFNEIKIESTTKQGVTMSDSRKINLYAQKIDKSYVEKRLALIIGNADYKNSNPLQNPLNDAKAIAKSLKEVGFTVLLYLDADLKTMKVAMDEFGDKLKNFNIALFYYAGHGMQVKGNNYLIPIDASLKVEQDAYYDCIDAGQILGKMESAGTSTNIIILDACRDNPFARSWSSRSAGSGGKGMAFMDAPSGSIVAYATSPGKTASDGTGKNGLYTEAFLKYVKVPNLSLEEFFKSVRSEVEKNSNKTQTPWEASSLKGSFFFKIK